MVTEKKERDHLFNKGVCIAVGVLFGIVIALMVITGSSSLNQFYNGGKVYEARYSDIRDVNVGIVADMTDGTSRKLRVVQGSASKGIKIEDSKNIWNYILLELSQMNRESVAGTVICYDEKNEPVYQTEVSLTEGRNLIETEGIAYTQLQIVINNQVGTEFSIDKMQFREKLVEFSWSHFGVIWGVAFLVYLAVIFIIRKIRILLGKDSFDWYHMIEWLQGLYIIVGEALGGPADKISPKRRSRIRTGLFAFLILYMQVVMNLVIYESYKWYKVHMLVCCLIVLMIGALCYEKKLKQVNWRNKLVWAWTVLWIMVCISDFFVGKLYSFSGYIMLLVIGFFYFMWHNMKERGRIFHDFIMGIRVSFWLTSAFCFLCRPLTEGQQYMGAYFNPVKYAMYVLFVWIALLGDIDYKINRKEKLLPGLLPELAEVSLAGFLLWQTQSSSGVIPAVFVFLIFIFKQLIVTKTKQIRRRGLAVIAAAVMAMIIISPAAKWGLTNIPRLLETQVKFERDVYVKSRDKLFPEMRVYAAENEKPNHHVIEKFYSNSFEEFTTGRSLYWTAHLRETNLLGHKFQEVLWGARRWPHNGFVAMIYRYGLFIIIPYVIMVFINLGYAFRKMFQWKKNYGFYLFSVMAASIILIAMENLELPFLFLCWISMYLLMGINFIEEEREK